MPSNNRLHLTALSAPPALGWRRRFVLAGARTAPQLKRVLVGHTMRSLNSMLTGQGAR